MTTRRRAKPLLRGVLRGTAAHDPKRRRRADSSCSRTSISGLNDAGQPGRSPPLARRIKSVDGNAYYANGRERLHTGRPWNGFQEPSDAFPAG